MPGKLEIKNASSKHDIYVSVVSVTGKEKHLENQKITPGESVSAVVKGGVKKLIVSEDGAVFWMGLIPSYGNAPVTVYPERKTILYRDTVLVNLLKYVSEKDSGKGSSMWLWIIIAVIVIIIAVCLYYKYKPGK